MLRGGGNKEEEEEEEERRELGEAPGLCFSSGHGGHRAEGAAGRAAGR